MRTGGDEVVLPLLIRLAASDIDGQRFPVRCRQLNWVTTCQSASVPSGLLTKSSKASCARGVANVVSPKGLDRAPTLGMGGDSDWKKLPLRSRPSSAKGLTLVEKSPGLDRKLKPVLFLAHQLTVASFSRNSPANWLPLLPSRMLMRRVTGPFQTTSKDMVAVTKEVCHWAPTETGRLG